MRDLSVDMSRSSKSTARLCGGLALAVAGKSCDPATFLKVLTPCRVETYPPWDSRGEWVKLQAQCHEFKANLPRQHTLTPQNTQAHISLKTSTPYTLIHVVYLLCQIMLHREYVPFIPIRCSKPQGPLDPPLFPSDKYDIPPNFWDDSARECFKAARETMDLVRSCQEWNALVETPIIGFAIYTVAFIGVYCINFPWMDPNGYMCTQPTPKRGATAPGESGGFLAARKALEIIGQMRLKLHMADGWFKTINRMHRYLRRMKSDYQKNVQAMDASESDGSPVSTRHLSLREGGTGGGLDEFKLLEGILKDFGNLDDQDVDMTDAGQRPGSRSQGDAYDDSSAGMTVKSEEQEHRAVNGDQARAEDRGPWNAINAGPVSSSGDRPPSVSASSGQFRSYESYPSQPQPTPQPQQPQQHYANQIQINNFRPAYSHGTPSVPGAPPSLTSPASHSASTSSQPRPSPPFDRRPSQSYSSWNPHASGYPMPLPAQQQQQQQQQPQASYANGLPHHTQIPTPMQHTSTYVPDLAPQQQQSIPPTPLLQPPPWDLMQKEAWLNSLPSQMSADDLAAFTNGGELQDWAMRNGNYGWLSTLWHGSAGG